MAYYVLSVDNIFVFPKTHHRHPKYFLYKLLFFRRDRYFCISLLRPTARGDGRLIRVRAGNKLMCPEGPRQNALNGPTLIFIICFKQSKVNLASFVAV